MTYNCTNKSINTIKNYIQMGFRRKSDDFCKSVIRHPCQQDPVLMSTMQHRSSTIHLIVTTTLVLHNLMRIRYPRLQNSLLDRDDRSQHLIPGEWRRGRQMQECRVVHGPNRDNHEGKKLHNLLKHWVHSPAGSFPWQDYMICTFTILN